MPLERSTYDSRGYPCVEQSQKQAISYFRRCTTRSHSSITVAQI